MKAKQIIAIILIIFVVGSVTYMVSREQKANSDSVNQDNNSGPTSPNENRTYNQDSLAEQNGHDFLRNTEKQDASEGTQLIVYYFHGDIRCPTCYKLESYAKEAIQRYFADELDSGDIVWKAVNVDRSENRHFIKDYNLISKSVVLSETKGEQELKWENLEQIWQKVSDKEAYLAYIRDSVTKFLEENGL